MSWRDALGKDTCSRDDRDQGKNLADEAVLWILIPVIAGIMLLVGLYHQDQDPAQFRLQVTSSVSTHSAEKSESK